MDSDSIIINEFFKEHPKDVAEALEELEPDRLAEFFSVSSTELLQEVIPHMSAHLLSAVYEGVPPEKLAQLFESMELHLTVGSIRMMKEEQADLVTNMLSEEKALLVQNLLRYIDGSVGAHMDPAVYTLEEDQTVKEAVAEIRKLKKSIQPHLFVLNADRKLTGVLSVSGLIAGSPNNEIKSIMSTKITAFSPETPLHSILTHPEWVNFYALPVVDNSSFFLGAIQLESIRSIQIKSSFKGGETSQATVNALGELYRIGLTGLLRSAADLKTPSEE